MELSMKMDKMDKDLAKYFEDILQLTDKNRWKEAFTRSKEILKTNPNCAMAHFINGVHFYNESEHKKALKAFGLSIKYDKDYYLAYVNIGRIYLKIEKYPNGLNILERAARLFPTEHLIFIELSKIYVKIDNLVNARSNIIRAIKLKSDNEMAHYQYGVVLGKLYDLAKNNGDDETASDYYILAMIQNMKVIQFNRNNIYAIYNIGCLYASTGSYCLFESDSYYYESQRTANKYDLMALEHFTNAISKFEHVIRIDPTYFLAYFKLANIYVELDKYEEAKENYKKVLELNPEYKLAQLQLEQIQYVENEMK